MRVVERTATGEKTSESFSMSSWKTDSSMISESIVSVGGSLCWMKILD